MNKGGKFFKRTVRDVPLEGQTVLLRTDFNVPLNKQGKISDDLRIKASLPTIEYLLSHKCRVVIISHLGRPGGKRQKKYSLEPAADRLAKLLKRNIHFVDATIGDRVHQAIKRSPKVGVVVLENLRFFAQEEKNDAEFAAKIIKASGARYFVQDGFGVVHRAHASTDAITNCLPGVAGLLLEHEYSTIERAMNSPKKPFIAIVGGAKVGDKIEVVEKFVDIADKIVVGGAMANTFLAYKGYDMGKSKYEKDKKEVLDRIYKLAESKVGKDKVDEFIVLPKDLAVAQSIDPRSKRRVVPIDKLAKDDIALDMGNESIERAVKIIEKAHTAVWNGTMGYAELPKFSYGSARVALTLAAHPKIESIIGGGDTADFVIKWSGGNTKLFSHISTGGGASLDLMSGKSLPGVSGLLDAR